MDGCTFSGNWAGQLGGAIFVEASLTVKDCTISGNEALWGGGICQIIYDNKNNPLTEDGISSLTLDATTRISGNRAVAGTLTLENGTSYTSEGLGGGIYIRVNATGSIGAEHENTHLKYDVYFTLGGATVCDNTAEGDGGGINFDTLTYAEGSEDQEEIDRFVKAININDGAIYGNTAGRNGGGIYVFSRENTTVTVSHARIYNNGASVGDGGGIYLSGRNATLAINDGTVIGGLDAEKKERPNTAGRKNGVGGHGGGIAITGGAAITMSGGEVSHNRVTSDTNTYAQGGGIWLDDGDASVYNSISITNGEISNNTTPGGTSGNGGGVYVGSYGRFTIQNGDILDNSCGSAWGGGVYTRDNSVVNIKGGLISGNTAGMGGGIAVDESSTAVVEGGTIRENTASGGAGIFVRSSSKLTVSGGFIENNTATGKDGGAGIHVAYNNTVEIKGGTIRNNHSANAPGGGIRATEDSTVTITDGTISGNDAVYGGGVSVNNSTLIFTVISAAAGSDSTGGSITGNSATEAGGGIYATNNGEVTVSRGNITGNSAKQGGGIAGQGGAKILVDGGTIDRNTASSQGGGIWVYEAGTTVTVNSGKVIDNVTDGSGGGIFIDAATATVQNIDTSTAAPTISNNTAARGGGVCVVGGGELTVNEGFIISNKAVGSPSVDTGFWQNTSLKGTGGGIFVADGVSDADRSSFTLAGNTVAIYDNRADFAADDVFANGKSTSLTVLDVENMELAGCGFPATGWFEDYPANDSSYHSGLNYFTGADRYDIVRYRGSIISQRGTVTVSAANAADTYVAMTLGSPAAMSDTVVVDFGLRVRLSVLLNDLGLDASNVPAIFFGPYNEAYDQGNVWTSADLSYDEDGNILAPAEFSRSYVTPFEAWANGIDAWENDHQGIYLLDHYVDIKGTDKFAYALSYVQGDTVYYFYANVYVVPATSIYYEDFLLDQGSNENDNASGYYDSTLNTDNGIGKWVVVKDRDVYEEDQNDATWQYQAEERPDIDDSSRPRYIYGYDPKYDKAPSEEHSISGRYSLGYAHQVTVDAATGTPSTAPYVTFRFTGTGFDVFSMTDSDCGLILVTVKNSAGTELYNYVVDTYYGYSYDDKTDQWTLASDPGNALYQVPVIKIKGMEYGTYTVEIKASYLSFFDHDEDGQYTVWIDGVRIYGQGDQDAYAQNIYAQDKESNPLFVTVKDLLVSQGSFDSVGGTTGSVFIDGRTGSVSIADYAAQGPASELYLMEDNAVAFRLCFTGSEPPMAVHIGAKLAKGTGADLMFKYGENGDLTKVKTLLTSTDMFYALEGITWTKSGNVYVSDVIYLSCEASTSGSILSLTDLKVTSSSPNAQFYGMVDANVQDAIAQSTEPTLLLLVDPEVVEQGLQMMEQQLTTKVTLPTLTLSYPSLSFESEIRYNVYFTAVDVDDVVEMGLITFSSRLSDGTIHDAVAVYPGIQSSGAMYMAQTGGIPAKLMGEALYFKVYAKLTDGTYVYSDVAGYNAIAYADTILANSQSAEMKALVVAMLNYGAEAQKFFGNNVDSLMTAGLTAQQQALVRDYDASMMDAPVAADSAKVGIFQLNKEGFTELRPTVSFDGAFSINYYFSTAYAPDNGMTMCYWTAEDYAAADVLAVENATGTFAMEATDIEGRYWGKVSDIPAKELDRTIYVAAFYTARGTTYCTGVIAYHVGRYCQSLAANSSSDMQALAAAAAVYGYYTKQAIPDAEG